MKPLVGFRIQLVTNRFIHSLYGLVKFSRVEFKRDLTGIKVPGIKVFRVSEDGLNYV